MILTKNIYDLMESCLKELSDIEFQQRVWLKGDGAEISSFAEVVCQLFDDTGIGDELSEKQTGYILSEELDSVLEEISKLLDSIDHRMDALKILNHPKWPKVCECSTIALKLLYKYYPQYQNP